MEKISVRVNARSVNLRTSAGEDGATFKPFVSENGIISWTNNKRLPNPMPVNIKGQKGDKGEVNINDSQILTDSTWSSSKINSKLDFGVTNIVRNSRNPQNLNFWGYIPKPENIELINSNYFGDSEKFFSIVNNTTSERILGTSRYKLEGGQTYTISMIVNLESNVSSMDIWVLMRYQNSVNDYDISRSFVTGYNSIKNKFHKIFFTLTIPENVVDGYIRIDHNGGDETSNRLWFSGVKLERGSISTDWSPSPLDFYDKFNNLDLLEIDDLNISQDETWSSNKINSEISSLNTNIGNEITNIDNHITEVENEVDNLNLIEIDDNNILNNKTWSSNKINSEITSLNTNIYSEITQINEDINNLENIVNNSTNNLEELDTTTLINNNTNELFNTDISIFSNILLKGNSILNNNVITSLTNNSGLYVSIKDLNNNIISKKDLFYKATNGTITKINTMAKINNNIYDSIYWDGVNYKYSKKVIIKLLNGSGSWSRENSFDTTFTERYVLDLNDSLYNSQGLSNVLEFGNFEDRSCIFIHSDGNIHIKRLKTDNRWNSLPSLKNFLDANNITLLYQAKTESIFNCMNIDLVTSQGQNKIEINATIPTNLSFYINKRINCILRNVLMRLSSLENKYI